jgi:hypothetical protein
MALADRLRGLADEVEIEVVAYVRRPSEQYLASVQQAVKASYSFASPQPIGYKRALQNYNDHVADRLHVVKYNPSAWPGGDVLRHFLTAFVPGSGDITTGPPQQVNRSLSAEAMSILADYRRKFWANDDNIFTPDTDALVHALAAADDNVDGNRRAVLHEHVQRIIDHESADLLWLRDEHGVTFDGVVYDDIQPSGRKRERPAYIDEICVVDPARKAELVRRVSSYVRRGPHRGVRWRRSLARWIAKYVGSGRAMAR